MPESKSPIKALLLENVHPIAVSMMEAAGYKVEALDRGLSEDELLEKIKDVSILGTRPATQITQKILENAPGLIAIGAFCVGTSHIDMKACSKKGIAVFNAPLGNTRSVAELAIGEIIMLMRNAFDKSMKLHNGTWDKSADKSHEILGKKLGIIGYGNIGMQLSVLAQSLGMEVLYYDLAEKPAAGNAKKCSSMKELLEKSDAVSIHIEGGSGTVISEKEMMIMKKGAILLNLSRGHVVDVKVLAKFIKNGRIAGAGIDVFSNEPKSNSEEFLSELRMLPNVILTPHIGGSTEEAQRSIGELVSRKLIDFANKTREN